MRDKLNGSRPTAFISSTFLDLERERKVVAEALANRGVLVNALEEIPASTSTSKEKILTGIDESDFVVLILGNRYGSILPRMTGLEQLSVTQWEYMEAMRRGKSILAFFMKWSPTEANRPEKLDDVDDKLFSHKQLHLRLFKDIVSKNHSERYVSSGEELADAVSKALIPVYRERLKNALDENAKLRRELESANSINKAHIDFLANLVGQTNQLSGKIETSGVATGLLSQIQNAGGGLRGSVNSAPIETPLKNSLGLLQGLRGLQTKKK